MQARNEKGQFAETERTKYHKGYKVVYMPNHPHARMNGYVYEHILIAEQKAGRKLLPEEVVHHVDGNKLNNSPDNLMIFKNNVEHMKHHWKSRREKFTASDGKTYDFSDIERITGLPLSTTYQRIHKLHWTIDEVLAGKRERIQQEGATLP